MAGTLHPLSRAFRTALAAIMAFALCPLISLAYADETAPSGGASGMDTAAIIKGGVESITASSNKDHSDDLFGSVEPHELDVANTVDVNFGLEYTPTADDRLGKGDTLTIALEPVGADTPDLLRVYKGFSDKNKEIHLNGAKIADLAYPDGKAMTFTFADLGDTEFHTVEAVHLEYAIDRAAHAEYFKKHADKKSVDLTYRLSVNGTPIEGKAIKLTVSNTLLPKEAKFVKTSGRYQEPQEGSTGYGSVMYSIYVSTKLCTNNEFVFYDTPDINQRFDGDFDMATPESYKGGGDALDFEGNHYRSNSDAVSPATEPMEIWLYDVYFLTKEAENANEPREAKYQEKTLVYEDRLVGGKPYASDGPAVVPADILLEKPSGDPLTSDEQARIDNAGGLNKTVGKGFKVRIKNFHGANAGTVEGGFITMTYTMNLVNNSPTIDEKGNPVYKNTASYFGQEIPIAPDNPVRHEGSTLDAVIKGNTTGSATIEPGGVIVEGAKYGTIDFTKVAVPADGAAETPLAGATFTVYAVDAEGKRTVAKTSGGILLENLVTNEAGKLCTSGSTDPVDLKLPFGTYAFVETAAPEGYELEDGKTETTATVGFIPVAITVTNKPVATEPDPGPEPAPDPDPDPDPEPEPGPDPGPQPSPGPDPEPEPAPDPEPNPDRPIEPDAPDGDGGTVAPDKPHGGGENQSDSGSGTADASGTSPGASTNASDEAHGGTLAKTGDGAATIAFAAFGAAALALATAATARTNRANKKRG